MLAWLLHFAVLQHACPGHRRCASMLKIVSVDFFKENAGYSEHREN
jgi:hypothetical protein